MDITNTGVVIIAFINQSKINAAAPHNALFRHWQVVRNLQWRDCIGGLGAKSQALENFVFFPK